MRILFLILGFSMALANTSCDNEADNTDEGEEQLCSTVTGQWDVASVTCDGTATPIRETVVTFDPTAGTISQTYGDVACSTTIGFEAEFVSSALGLTGSGNMSCSALGTSTNSCSGDVGTCDDSHSVAGIDNSYDQCVVSGGTTITLTRTVGSQMVSDNMTACADGETEVVTLNPADLTPTGYLLISDGPSFDYGDVATGSASSHSFTISNVGSGDATDFVPTMPTAFDFVGGSFPGTGGDCVAMLAAEATCTVVIEFAPTEPGDVTGTFSLSYNDSVSTKSATRDLLGRGTGGASAILVISDGPTYDFGPTGSGSTLTHTFSVENIGGATATAIFGVTLAPPFSFQGGGYPGTGGDCTSTLAAGTTCQIVVTFSPTVVGPASDTIVLNYNDGVAAASAERPIQGSGSPPAQLIISEVDPFDFGSVMIGNTVQQVFTVTNVGGMTASSLSESGLSAPFGFLGGSYPGVGGTCGATLDPGLDCTMVIEFAPGSLGVANDTVELNYFNGTTFQFANRDLTGQGTL